MKGKNDSAVSAVAWKIGVLIVLAVAGSLVTLNCGGGGTTATSSPSGGGGGGGGGGPVPACVTGTVSSYLGTSCSEGASVYHWDSYTCTSNPSSICDALGPNGSNVSMALDPQGPFTILIGKTSAWDVTAGQNVDVKITGSVYGADSNQNWPHFRGIPGCTGDGIEDNKTTVACSATGNCLDSNNGVSEVLCSLTSPLANGVDESSIAAYGAYRATFNPAPSSSPYPLTIEITLNGGTNGSAALFSVGTHLIPPGAK